jgi:hypothetical protein
MLQTTWLKKAVSLLSLLSRESLAELLLRDAEDLSGVVSHLVENLVQRHQTNDLAVSFDDPLIWLNYLKVTLYTLSTLREDSFSA